MVGPATGKAKNLTFLLLKSRFFCRPIHARASKFQSFFRPWVGSRVKCSVTRTHASEQLAQGCYQKVDRPRTEPATFRVTSHNLNTAKFQNLRLLRSTGDVFRPHNMRRYLAFIKCRCSISYRLCKMRRRLRLLCFNIWKCEFTKKLSTMTMPISYTC